MAIRFDEAMPLFQALAATVLAVLATAGLCAAGVATGLSLFCGLALAGALSVAGLAALNGALNLPTSKER